MKLQKLKTLLALVAVCLMAVTAQAQTNYFRVKNNLPILPVFANTAAVTPVPTQAGAMIYSTADATIMIYSGSAWIKYQSFSTMGASGGFAVFTIKNGLPYLPFLNPAVYTGTGAPSGGMYLTSSATSNQLRISNGTAWAQPALLSASAARPAFQTGALTNFPGGVALPVIATVPTGLTAAEKGAVFINSTTNLLNVYSGAGWVALTPTCPPFVMSAVLQGNQITMSGFVGGHGYSDKSGRTEGTSKFAYWTSDNADGTGNATPATPVYSTPNAGWSGTFTSALNKKYLNFSVIPFASDGQMGDALSTSLQFDNCAPTISPLDMGLDMYTVRSSTPVLVDPPGYSYFDKEQNPEGTPIVKWYRGTAQSSPGTATYLASTSGTAKYSYQYVAGDPLYYLYAEVTPVSTQGNTSDPANAVISAVGQLMWPNCPPAANGVLIYGTLTAGQTLTVGYSIIDREGDVEGTPVYQWYTTTDGVDKTPIPGQTAVTFNSTGYAGVKIMVGVTPTTAITTNPPTEALSPYVQL